MIIFHLSFWLTLYFPVWHVAFENLPRSHWFFENSMNKIFIGDGSVFTGHLLHFGYCTEKKLYYKRFFRIKHYMLKLDRQKDYNSCICNICSAIFFYITINENNFKIAFCSSISKIFMLLNWKFLSNYIQYILHKTFKTE